MVIQSGEERDKTFSMLVVTIIELIKLNTIWKNTRHGKYKTHRQPD